MNHLDAQNASPEHPAADRTPTPYRAIAESAEFVRLRGTFRGFAFPMTIAGLASYFSYVVASIFLPGFMGRPLFGTFSVGMVIGLAQFAVTWAWTAIYVNFATRRLDPLAGRLRADLEGQV